MRRTAIPVLAVVVLLFSGCYHATVNTGAAPGPATHEIWANSWIAGLIAPKTVDAAALCGGRRVARVETQHTILNQIVTALTGGIYSPLTIEVTCAAA